VKTEYKVEGTNLKVAVSHDVVYDSDKDGVAAVDAKVVLDLTLNGMELADELLKSTAIAQKIKEKLIGLGLIKPDAVVVAE